MWKRVLETFSCLISGREKMPGMKFEDAFSPDALKSIKEEYEWLKKHAQRVSPSIVCTCPEHCHYHTRKIFEEQRARIDEFMAGGLQHKEENDYVLKDGVISCWITVDNLSVYVHRADEGVVADIFAHGSEMTEPLGSTWVTRDDAQEVLDQEKEDH